MDLLRLLSGGLLGLSTPGLPGRGLLLGLLRAADGADTGNSVLTDVTTVVVLSGDVGNTLVDPDLQSAMSDTSRFSTRSSAMAQISSMRISGVCLLAGGGLGAVVHVNEGLSGLLGSAGLLSGDSNAAVLGALNTNCLKYRKSNNQYLVPTMIRWRASR